MNKQFIQLLLVTSTTATTPSPTKSSISDKFPAFQHENTETNGFKFGAAAADVDINTSHVDGSIKDAFMQNEKSKNVGYYHLFRVPEFVVAPTQGIAKGTTAADLIYVTSLEKGKTLYETKKDNLGAYLKSVGTALTVTTRQSVTTYGDYMGACLVTKLTKASNAKPYKDCWSMAGVKFAAATGNAESQDTMPNRIIITTNATQDGIVVGDADPTKTADLFKYDKDLILATLYQSNGDSNTSGETWCSGGWQNERAVTDNKITLKGQLGFGPKAKCTWQVVSKTNTAAPAISLTATPKTDMLIQVIEWYNTAQLTTNMLIDATKAKTTPGFIAKDENEYKASEGVFFNPFTTVPDKKGETDAIKKFSVSTIVPNNQIGTVISVQNSQSNAQANIPNSIGTALYYERDEGQSLQTIRKADSSMFLNAYGVYNAVKTGFESQKSEYDTKKKEYETAVEDKKKDPKKELPKRPDMPSVPAAYSGPYFMLSTQNMDTPSKSWTDDIKKEKTAIQVLLATESDAYTAGNLGKSFHNRVGYLMASKTSSKDAIKGVGATFGRLGQGVNTQLDNASPFLWNKAESNARPGFMVSLFPEYVRANSGTTNNGWNDWVVTTTQPTIEAGVKTLLTAKDFDSPTAPSAATAIADVASKLATASLATATLVAASLF